MQNINRALQQLKIEGITIIRDKVQARKAIDILYKNRNRAHAWDTETYGVNVKEQSPALGVGRLICASAFIGPEVNFGNGPRLFVDNYQDAQGVIDTFKDYFEDKSVFKVWHNYGFDRHIFYNEGINVQGFGGDTLHMARLCDTSLNEYSLEGCSKQWQDVIQKVKQTIITKIGQIQNLEPNDISNAQGKKLLLTKTSINKLIQSLNKQKPGKSGKTNNIPDIIGLHTSPEHIQN